MKVINKIYLERKKTYNEADFRIKCNFLKPEIIVNKILKLYEKVKKLNLKVRRIIIRL